MKQDYQMIFLTGLAENLECGGPAAKALPVGRQAGMALWCVGRI